MQKEVGLVEFMIFICYSVFDNGKILHNSIKI